MARLDGNGLRAPKPNEKLANSINGAIKRGHNRYLKNGKVILMRYKSRDNAQTRRNKDKYGLPFEEEPLELRNINRGSEARRAATNEQTLTRQDYVDYAKRNGYPVEQANQLFEENEARLKELKGQKSATQHYEHLLPTRSPMRGGVEHYRNIVMMGSEENLAKSDYLASIPAAREAGVPLTKQGALFADFNQLPLPTDQRRVDIILKDIGSQEAPKTTRDVRAALQQSEMAEAVGQKFKFSGGNVKLGAALGALPVAGAIFDVGDVQAGVQGYMNQQQTPMQQFGSGLQAVSGATGLVAMVPTPASPALGAVSAVTGGAAAAVQSGAVSKAIEQAPSAVKKIQQIERILNPVGASITNELKFIGGQVRLGKIPYFN
jgi:hypothetical protein